MPLGTNLYLVPLENWAYGGGFNPNGEVFTQRSRLIIFCLEGCHILVQKVIFVLMKIVN